MRIMREALSSHNLIPTWSKVAMFVSHAGSIGLG